jgi:fermentation-respiration switch protein FrsA (DUF1100 family)
MNIKCNNIIFNSNYNFGPKDQQILKKNYIVNMFEDIIIRPFKTRIFPGASILKNKFIDVERSNEAKKQLLAIGGKPVQIRTPDGDLLSGMYLNTKNFKKCMEKYFKVSEEWDNDSIKQKLIIKDEFCSDEKRESQGEVYIYKKPNNEVQSFLDTINSIGLDLKKNGLLFNSSKEGIIRGPFLELDKIPNNVQFVELSNSRKSTPTVLIATGSGLSYNAYKGLAAAYLMRGINVMMVDFRGYGESKGNPTAHKTKLDLESAYQYLSVEKGIENKDLIIHGHCLGGGPATDLAARRKGINLILDRSFAEYRDLARNKFPIIGEIIYRIMPWIFNYNNVENLGKIDGHIAIEMAYDDVVIEEEQIVKQINSLKDTKKGQLIKLMDSNGGHTGLWTDHSITSLQFNEFLEQAQLRKRLF